MIYCKGWWRVKIVQSRSKLPVQKCAYWPHCRLHYTHTSTICIRCQVAPVGGILQSHEHTLILSVFCFHVTLLLDCVWSHLPFFFIHSVFLTPPPPLSVPGDRLLCIIAKPRLNVTITNDKQQFHYYHTIYIKVHTHTLVNCTLRNTQVYAHLTQSLLLPKAWKANTVCSPHWLCTITFNL